MKTILFLIISISATPLFAGVAWVQTPFWQAPYENSQTLNTAKPTNELVEECKYFESKVWDKNGNNKILDPSDFEMLNTMALPSDMTNQFFYTELKTDVTNNLVIGDHLETNTNIVKMVVENEKSDSLPFYSQVPSQIQIDPKSLSNIATTIEKQEKSLIAMNEQLSLPKRTAVLMQKGGSFFVVFRSKDIICDLLAHRANIKIKAKAQIKIILDNQIKLQNTYSELQSLSQSIMDRSKSQRVRAALIGYKIGGFFENRQTLPKERVENHILQFMNQFFDLETMEPNKNWKEAFGKKILDVDGISQSVDVNLAIQIQP